VAKGVGNRSRAGKLLTRNDRNAGDWFVLPSQCLPASNHRYFSEFCSISLFSADGAASASGLGPRPQEGPIRPSTSSLMKARFITRRLKRVSEMNRAFRAAGVFYFTESGRGPGRRRRRAVALKPLVALKRYTYASASGVELNTRCAIFTLL